MSKHRDKWEEHSDCEYKNCGMPVFATENVTGTKMRLCQECFKTLFGKIMQNAKIIDKTL